MPIKGLEEGNAEEEYFIVAVCRPPSSSAPARACETLSPPTMSISPFFPTHQSTFPPQNLHTYTPTTTLSNSVLLSLKHASTHARRKQGAEKKIFLLSLSLTRVS